MKITGTIINYYFHCKRQCYLFANRINMEDNSEDVRIGRVLHEIRAKISDFGLTRVSVKTANMSCLGTPLFAAPEVCTFIL